MIAKGVITLGQSLAELASRLQQQVLIRKKQKREHVFINFHDYE